MATFFEDFSVLSPKNTYLAHFKKKIIIKINQWPI